MAKLTVALATFNEETNLPDCLASIKNIASEIVIVDGSSTDKTVEIARQFGAKVHVTDNPPIFHINKQKALEMATGDWILQLDADERVSKPLASEIQKVIAMDEKELEEYQQTLPQRSLFLRHQKLLEQRDGSLGTNEGSYAAFFIPRLNFFLGRYLRHGGVYPDGVIRLVRRGKAHFPCKDVHEQIAVDGKVGWLQHDLYHFDSPTFARYLQRNNRYVDLIAKDLREQKTGKSPLTASKYLVGLPAGWFLSTFFRHKGFLDSWQGFVFSWYSALRFPKAYLRYLRNR